MESILRDTKGVITMDNSFLFRHTKAPPCGKNCPKRKVGCKITCRDYVEWEQEHHKKKEIVDKIYKAHQDIEIFKAEVRANVKLRKVRK